MINYVIYAAEMFVIGIPIGFLIAWMVNKHPMLTILTMAFLMLSLMLLLMYTTTIENYWSESGTYYKMISGWIGQFPGMFLGIGLYSKKWRE